MYNSQLTVYSSGAWPAFPLDVNFLPYAATLVLIPFKFKEQAGDQA
jgi:hypothetical protein